MSGEEGNFDLISKTIKENEQKWKNMRNYSFYVR